MSYLKIAAMTVLFLGTAGTAAMSGNLPSGVYGSSSVTVVSNSSGSTVTIKTNVNGNKTTTTFSGNSGRSRVSARSGGTV